MKREKLVYNRETLQYETVSLTTAQKSLRLAALISGIVAYTALIWFLLPKSSNEANTNRYLRENRQLKEQLLAMSVELDQMAQALDNLQERDNGIYRNVLKMKPSKEQNWGKIKALKLAELEQNSSEELVVKIHEKLAQTKQRMAVLAQSQEEILSSFSADQKRIAAIPSIRPIQRTERPLEQLSGFGMRSHPFLKTPQMHTGIDFGAPMGAPIYATGDAKVVRVEYKTTGYGYNVVLDHGYGFQTLYAHMSKILVKPGQKVKRGETIGLIGSTGLSTSPHVHYEVFVGGERVDPAKYIMDLSPEEYRKFVDQVSSSTSSAH